MAAEKKEAAYRFTVKERPNQAPWLFADLQRGDDIFGDGVLHLELSAGVSYEDAQAVARYLNEHVAALAYTRTPGRRS